MSTYAFRVVQIKDRSFPHVEVVEADGCPMTVILRHDVGKDVDFVFSSTKKDTLKFNSGLKRQLIQGVDPTRTLIIGDTPVELKEGDEFTARVRFQGRQTPDHVYNVSSVVCEEVYHRAS